VIDTRWGEALTFSCATCHATSFFGRTVVGLTNREARANEFFHLATLFFPAIDPGMFGDVTGATDAELELFVRTQTNLPAVGAKVPEVAGLDTALAQVGLSLVRRADDGWATRDRGLEITPEPTDLDTFVADSKPAVWWTLKRKTRWLSDGSIVSGNPIFTNFLWNELGRATDLGELDAWFGENGAVVDELTAAVFATEAPRWTDFFPASTLDLDAARRGEALFADHCAACHGTYEKDWDDADDPFATVSVRYAEQTRPVDVGTDPQRAQGMSRFAEGLNGLELSGTFRTVVEVQRGYVPPPLDGIWARYPYLHHEAVPTLCDLLRPAEARPVEFWVGPTENPTTDFDAACVGYPTGESVPEAWKAETRRHYDTRRAGLGNQGHDAWLVDSDGAEILSADDRADLVMFLKTL
jgi:mono/diheme cytochrome c family protein